MSRLETFISFINCIYQENVVDTIIKHLENGDLDKVRNLIENNCQEDDVKEELVRKIVNSRSIKAVTHLLKVNQYIGSAGQFYLIYHFRF